jgi:hypothetical protein
MKEQEQEQEIDLLMNSYPEYFIDTIEFIEKDDTMSKEDKINSIVLTVVSLVVLGAFWFFVSFGFAVALFLSAVFGLVIATSIGGPIGSTNTMGMVGAGLI